MTHSAPSVTYPVGRSLFLRRILILFWLGGAAATALGSPVSGPGDWRTALAGAALLLAAVMAWRFWRGLATGVLQWDGHAWQGLPPAAGSAQLRVHLDLQRHLLVRLHGMACAPQWLWLEAAFNPARWSDVRRAVYSRAMPDPQRDAANP